MYIFKLHKLIASSGEREIEWEKNCTDSRDKSKYICISFKIPSNITRCCELGPFQLVNNFIHLFIHWQSRFLP